MPDFSTAPTATRPDVPAADAATVRGWLQDGQEIALLDVREAGPFGEGHPFLAIPAPYSRLESEVTRLVPRRAVRTVLVDGGDGVAERAAARLAALGYSDLHVLRGGAPAWAAGGRALFKGVNVPSKTFGELVEHAFGTPHIGPGELRRRQQAGERLALLDGRTFAEHGRMTVPGAVSVPNGELALHWRALVSDAGTPIVVHCAGRTRSIIGAQILRSLGIPNPVVALENGTQGWALEGLALEHGSTRRPAVRATASAEDRAAAERLRSGTGADRLSAAGAQRWIDDAARTTYVLDVRSAEEFAAGTLPGAIHAPGGQLLQATDQTIGVRNARVLLLDDEDMRAPVIAAWLWRLGYETATVHAGIRAPLQLPPAAVVPAPPPAPQRIAAQALAGWNAAHGPAVLDLQPSQDHRRRHAPGARWSIRPRVAEDALATGWPARPLLLLAPDAGTAAWAAAELAPHSAGTVAWARPQDWADAGLPEEATPHVPGDAQCIDYLFFVHDRHDGNLDAARRYLEWETGLIAQCAPEELAGFRLPPAGTPAAQ
ncbi:rhodanese-like domain-containing protein [Acidovorax sp. GBBC 3334]|uniref:rhodanese-like domain-containing protein n=1 Tax=Acidovorax sp. GBBC 3334 TaxID=2940496 RepID=UPI00230463A2|nr:rhodanese-like domain-containing protein [Acidovorax sp. GBBC 3334]MDA8455822.1 rhodanese-like domain-containing protein [Acidovorax sp. GBBC 3334]